MKPTDMDRYTKKRYYQLKDTLDMPWSEKKHKRFLNRKFRRKNNQENHLAKYNPKMDISSKYKSIGTYLRPWTTIGNSQSSYFWYALTKELITIGPDPDYSEIKRLPAWMRYQIFENIKTHNFEYSLPRKNKLRFIDLKLLN